MDISWELVLPLVIAILIALFEHLAKGKYKKYLNAAFDLNRIVYASIETANAFDVKKLVKQAVIAGANPIVEINNVLLPLVDEKKAKSAAPIIRFWRRFIRGKNLPGVVARTALQGAIAKHIQDE